MNKTVRCLSFLALSTLSTAHAGVYIAPLDDDGSTEFSEDPMYIEVDSKRVQTFLPKSQSESQDKNIPMTGSDRMSVKSAAGEGGMSRGAGVPMRQAVQAVLPDDDWAVNFDGSVSPREPAVWAADGNWADILRDISKRNDVSIAVNEEDKVVGISRDPGYARLLSAADADIDGIREARQAGVPAADRNIGQMKAGDKVWYIAKDKTVRENLQAWTDRADWYLDWDYPADYTMAAPAQFVGTFKEAARELMYSLSDAGYPIGAEVRTKNRVLRIRGIK